MLIYSLNRCSYALGVVLGFSELFDDRGVQGVYRVRLGGCVVCFKRSLFTYELTRVVLVYDE